MSDLDRAFINLRNANLRATQRFDKSRRRRRFSRAMRNDVSTSLYMIAILTILTVLSLTF